MVCKVSRTKSAKISFPELRILPIVSLISA